MYLLLALLVPLLFLFNTYLAMAGLIAAIVGMYIQRTKPARRAPRREEASPYTAGYE